VSAERAPLIGEAGSDILIACYIQGLSDAQLGAILGNWVNASSYAAAVAAVTGSSGTKFITDGSYQNVFSDSYADKLTGNAGQDLFLADTTLDETGAVKDTITDTSSGEVSLDIDRL
jgi:hypothetical protein